LSEAFHGPELAALRDALDQACHRAGEALASFHLPVMPSREELMAQARHMFARTPSLDEIVDRGYVLLATAIRQHLAAYPAAAVAE